MKYIFFALALGVATAPAQAPPDAPVVVNSREATWRHESDDPPGGESLMLRMDRQTGAMEFFARNPAGYTLKPHSHKANERLLLMEGRAMVQAGEKKTNLDPGGFAYFPAGQVHSVTCDAGSRCVFYVAWDRKP